ncbi:hypothetical protein L1D14_23015 [Vibrio tubiashii]|uniref:hypothetical protein n=1 Tax=Vibrio tubiashii TaxID=29498 RepID=UPI001EFD15F4|nr:hypothetical protein [Vibrio tubiashii]MCG9579076.1 hypothetical protein [Vibrio tubiashii]
MKLKIINSGLKSHKTLLVSGEFKAVETVTKAINDERMHYKMDYAHFEHLEGNRATAEFIAHRKHHYKAASFIRRVILEARTS